MPDALHDEDDPSMTRAATIADTAPKKAPSRNLLARIWRHRAGSVGLSLILLFFVMAVLAPFIAPYDPTVMHRGYELTGPSAQHWFGTDQYGRDLFSRVLYGLRTSFSLSFIAVSSGAAVGVVFGLMAGYFGGAVETVLMRVSDVLLPFPAILLGIGLAAVIGVGTMSVAIAIAIVSIPVFARITRASTLAEREKDYVEATRALGMTTGRIMFRHILPNCISPLLVQFSVAMAHAIIVEAGLSFLGVGTQPPTASLGAMLDTARGYMRSSPSFAIFPGLTITLLLLGLNYLADALRDITDPKKR